MTALATGTAATTVHLEAETPAALSAALEDFLRTVPDELRMAVVASFVETWAPGYGPVHQQVGWVGSELRPVDIFLKYHLILAAVERP